MKQLLTGWIDRFGLADSELAYYLAVVGLIVVVSLLIHLILHRVVLRFLAREREQEAIWRNALFGHKLFSRLALTLQGVVVFSMANAFLEPDSVVLALIETLTHLWIILFALLALFSLLDTVETLSRSAGSRIKLPLRGIFQSLKLVGTTVALIFATAFLIGKSPLILFSGLGAMTAVILLIFKDPILGLVAGIQLSANDMLAVGDWLEMPRYGADGDVIDISLTTVKVRNWDKTITSIPSYALISDSFKNWRNIDRVGGRRIKRAINIDASSVRFASTDDLERLRQARLLADHIDATSRDIERFNQDRGVDPDSPINARRMTNLGLFRAYMTAYLADHDKINHDLTFMVRQLAPGPNGIPMEIYGFANNTSWVPYENIQSDIFDHVYAVLPQFGLRLHQSPSGHDVARLGSLAQRSQAPS
jgi:miniconductance mechanosensitive channel